MVFLNEIYDSSQDERLSRDDLEAIKRGLEDIKAGRYITLEEYVATL
ncbi:MAG TPA: hypothetical protein PKI14_15060 [Fervidobacterium sp.]|nr:hypothetical protein [Fervidobacterium sp.]